VQVLGIDKLAVAYAEHSGWKASLENWHAATGKAVWRHLADVKQTFRHADQFGGCVVFNISHNRCRLIATINYQSQRLIVLHVLGHMEYDREKWKNDCCP
jgi:mRNA interferase HigB